MTSSGHSLLSIQDLNIEYRELEAQFGELKGHVEMLTAEIRAIRDRENREASVLSNVQKRRLSDSEMDKSPGGRISSPLGQPKKRRLKVEVWIDCPRLLNSSRAGEHRNPNPGVGIDTAHLTFDRHGQAYEDINYEIDPNDMAVDLSLEHEGRNFKGSTTHPSGYIRTSPFVEEELPVETDTEQPIPNNLVRRSLRGSALVNSRLAKANARLLAIDLDDRNKWVTVSRAFMSSVYVGTTRGSFTNINDERYDHQYVDETFMYLNLHYNPNAPRTPGEPGLWFGVEPFEGVEIGPYRTFVRLRYNKWLYVDQYELEMLMPLSKEEWHSQKLVVRHLWAKSILTRRWARQFRASIILQREIGRPPSADEILDALDSENEFKNLTLKEIKASLATEQQRMGVWTMKCIEYDESFQREIATKFQAWAPPPKQSKRQAVGF